MSGDGRNVSGATRVNGGEFAGPPPAVGGRVDDDTVSRFATCCSASTGSVGVRPPAPGRSLRRARGFGALTIADDQCDAWAGLAAAGDTSP